MKPISADIIQLNKNNRTALVKTNNGNKFPVKISMPNYLLEDLRLGDTALITKSTVSNEWLMIDYSFCNSLNYTIHNSYQETMDDLILKEDGVPYGF